MVLTDDREITVEVELFVREGRHGTHGTQAAARDRLDRLHREGVVGEYAVHDWPARVCCPEAPAGERAALALDRLEQFERWAERTGLDLGPAFDRRRVASPVLREEYEAVVFPVRCLAVYGPDRLWTVAPCTDGQRCYSVEDCLTALEAGETPAPAPARALAGPGGGQPPSTVR